MAFQQPTRQSTQRVFRPASEEEEQVYQSPEPAVQAVEDSQTWVLFSPATDAGTSTSSLTNIRQSDATAGRSRLSDIGSLNTVARSEGTADFQPSASYADVIDEEEEEEDDDDAELDSLDSHLPEFRSTPNFFTSSVNLTNAPVLPAHDGLGSFRLDAEGMGAADMQDRLYAFERYNPRRVKRRRESLELAQLEVDPEQAEEAEKMQRIESWRLEHSRYLLNEIHKETRRRRRSQTTQASTRTSDRRVDATAVLDPVGDSAHEPTGDWHDQPGGDVYGDRESLWGRITRKVIRDIMGIDDKLLSVLFGEELPDEEDLSSTPKANSPMSSQVRDDTPAEMAKDANWQLKILERIARELGLFVHQLSEHPGAFSTFKRVQHMNIPYAGLPPISETANSAEARAIDLDASIRTPEFQPTIAQQTRPIEIRTAHSPTSQLAGEAAGATFTQEEWEQDLDVRLVFRYLRSRFMSRSSSAGGLSGSSHLASSTAQDIAAKAARVRQHHPLVSRSRPTERRNFKATSPSSPVLFRPASSCASQSTRRSVRRSSVSSRHYWDIGGSVGTGSMIATTGPMGSWGEV